MFFVFSGRAKVKQGFELNLHTQSSMRVMPSRHVS